MTCRRCRESVVASIEGLSLNRTPAYIVIRSRRFCFDCGRYLIARRIKQGRQAYASASYAMGMVDTSCPICGNPHTGESCVVDPGV